MRQWIRTCQECGYKLAKSEEPSDQRKASAAYGFVKCPKCKSEAFDYGSWQDPEAKPYTED